MNREKMRELCSVAGSYPEAARLIILYTEGRSVSVDAIKSWTCKATSSRARTCPDWVIEALEKQLVHKITKARR